MSQVLYLRLRKSRSRDAPQNYKDNETDLVSKRRNFILTQSQRDPSLLIVLQVVSLSNNGDYAISKHY